MKDKTTWTKEGYRCGRIMAPFILFLIIVQPILTGGCAMTPVMTTEREREVGAEQARKVERIMGLLEDPGLVSYVETIGDRLAEHSPRQEVTYSFHVVDMAQPNAFALPGGYIYVSRGLLALVNSEDELAGVLAHEVAHVAGSHHAKSAGMSAATSPFRIGAGILGAATSIISPALGDAVVGMGQVASASIIAPYSRDQEREADRVGQEISAQAGWDPEGLNTFLKTLEKEEVLHSADGQKRSSFFSTHPAMSERVEKTTQQARGLLPGARNPIAKNRAELLSKLDGLIVGENPSHGLFAGNRFLHPDLGFTIRFPDKWRGLNTTRFVVAQAPEEDAAILVQIAGRGEDPLMVARAMEESMEVKLLENAVSTRIGDLRAVRTFLAARISGGNLGFDLTWIAHGGFVYLIQGVCLLETCKSYRGAFATTAESFRPLTAVERSNIKVALLNIVTALEDETPGELVERVGGVWTPSRTAVANAISEDTRLKEGQLIKIPILEPYFRRR